MCLKNCGFTFARTAPSTTAFGQTVTQIQFRKRTFFGHRSFTFSLVDTAGEEWHYLLDPNYDCHREPKRGHYRISTATLGTCSGLIMFLEVKPAEGLSEMMEPNQDIMCANVLAQLQYEYRRDKFPRPVALVLTKADRVPLLLHQRRKAEDYLNHEYPLTAGQARRNLKTWRVFSTSAVGTSMKEQPAELRPVRLWDPILWLLRSL